MSNVLRILLAEDNPADVYLIEEALREHKVVFELTVAQDGEQAIAILDGPQPCPDIVLVDLNMPKQGGFDVVSRLRLRKDCQSVPIMVLTSSESPADRAQILSLGANEYVRKPTGLDEFLEIGRKIRDLAGR